VTVSGQIPAWLASTFRQKGHMGGYGSGRRHSLDRHRQVESCLILNADTIPRPILAGNEGEVDLTLRSAPQFVRCSYLMRCDGRGFELVLWTPPGPISAATLLAHARRPRKSFPTREAAQRRIDRQRARATATLTAAAGPARRPRAAGARSGSLSRARPAQGGTPTGADKNVSLGSNVVPCHPSRCSAGLLASFRAVVEHGRPAGASVGRQRGGAEGCPRPRSS
jgi:hypothetical protein